MADAEEYFDCYDGPAGIDCDNDYDPSEDDEELEEERKAEERCNNCRRDILKRYNEIIFDEIEDLSEREGEPNIPQMLLDEVDARYAKRNIEDIGRYDCLVNMILRFYDKGSNEDRGHFRSDFDKRFFNYDLSQAEEDIPF